MSLNFQKRKFPRSKSTLDISSSNFNLNDLFSGKGYIINDKLDKDYIQHCIKLSCESKFQKSKETERNKLFKRCRICRNFNNNEKLIYCVVCRDAFHYKCLNKDEKSYSEKFLKNHYECQRCIKIEKEKNQLLKYRQIKLDELFKNKNTNSYMDFLKNENYINNDIKKCSKNICYKCHKEIRDITNISMCEKCKYVFYFYNKIKIIRGRRKEFRNIIIFKYIKF